METVPANEHMAVRNGGYYAAGLASGLHIVPGGSVEHDARAALLRKMMAEHNLSAAK